MALDKNFIQKIGDKFYPGFFCDEPETLVVYGKDWTQAFDPNPIAVVFPRNTDEVSHFLKLCSQYHYPIVPSGGRTGLSGGSVAADGEIILSLDKMNHIGPVDTIGHTVQVQAGAVTESVHQHCYQHNLTWPVSFASEGSSQIGGNISTNAGGVNFIRYGPTRNWVLGLQVVLMNGQVLSLNGAVEKNNTGYDLKQLFVGSEGTLGIITEATLKLTTLPDSTHVFFFAISSMGDALRLLQKAKQERAFQIIACEYFEQNCLMAVEKALSTRCPLTERTPAYLLLEVDTFDKRPQKLDAWLSSLFEENLVKDGTLAQSSAETRRLWSFRENITESLSQLGFVHKNDISVPLSQLESFLAELTTAFRQAYPEVSTFVYGHIGDGNLHLTAAKPKTTSQDEFARLCQESDKVIYKIVQKYQGSISAEHGIGLLKKEFLSMSRSSYEIELFKSLKKLFDPKGLLNPGKIF